MHDQEGMCHTEQEVDLTSYTTVEVSCQERFYSLLIVPAITSHTCDVFNIDDER